MSRRRVGVVAGLLLAGLVGGLGVVGVNRMREAADRSKCQNNLRQIGIAFHAYADATLRPLPPLTDQGEGAPTGRGLPSAFGTLMPYMECMPIIYRDGQDPPPN